MGNRYQGGMLDSYVDLVNFPLRDQYGCKNTTYRINGSLEMQAFIRLFNYFDRRLLLAVAFLFNTGQGFAAFAVVTAHPLATEAGEHILRQGGNAFDAAVAVGAALAVVEPYASGLGGGGFWLLHRASDQLEVMIDGRETAPRAAYAAMYLDSTGHPDRLASLQGARAAAIPGTPAALVHITDKYGRFSLAKNLAPAIRLAHNGFIANERLIRAITHHRSKLTTESSSSRIFLPEGRVPFPGKPFHQPMLAKTLSQIAKYGKDGFYRGAVAAEMVRAVRQGGGIWTLEDLADYRIVERQPVSFTFRGTRITTTSLPSAGGATLAQALNILEYYPLDELTTAARSHLIVEAMRRAYEDRAKYLGDSDFITVDTKKLISKAYALHRAATIDMDQATLTPAEGVNHEILSADPGQFTPSYRMPLQEGTNTTHFSIMDSQGNRVAATLSINTFFGSGFVAGKTGVLLNNEMDDFVIAPDVPNTYGLRGGKMNAIAPGKRPLSSMSPTFLKNEKGILITGTPGGSRIISTLLLSIIDFAGRGQTNPEQLVASPRYHHQYLPDEIVIEPHAFDTKWIEALEAKGHTVKIAARPWGNMQLIFFDRQSGKMHTASDPRGRDYTRY